MFDLYKIKFYHIKNKHPEQGRWVIVPQDDGYFLGKYRRIENPLDWAEVEDGYGRSTPIMHFWAYLPELKRFTWKDFKKHGIDTDP